MTHHDHPARVSLRASEAVFMPSELQGVSYKQNGRMRHIETRPGEQLVQCYTGEAERAIEKEVLRISTQARPPCQCRTA